MQEAEVVALPRIIVKRWPGTGVDVLVNNAGLGRNNAALWDGSTASWVEMISTNVLGVCMCTREALKVLDHELCCSRMPLHRPLINKTYVICVGGSALRLHMHIVISRGGS